MKKIIKKETKNQRSTSVLLKGNNKYIDQEEKEKWIDSNENVKKGFHHRKRTSSYFFGSYLQNQNIIEINENNNHDNNKNLNYKTEEECPNDKEDNEIKNKLIYNIYNSENANDLSASFPSFPSYDENNNNNIMAKKEETSEKKIDEKKENNSNNLFLEIAKNSENSGKSFITLKNSLKYLKDKDERTTPSYQLALQAGKKGGKNSYVTVSNVIEEEKSSMIESKSEFSNKKDNFLNMKIMEEKETEKNILDEFFKDNEIKIHNNWNLFNGKFEDKNEMSAALNDIIIKNNKKEEDRKKYLTQNKKNLLHIFFSKTVKLNEIKDKNFKREENNPEKEKLLNDIYYNKYIKDRINNNEEYYSKKRFVKKFLVKPSGFSNQRNNQNNHALTENEYHNNVQINNLNNENNLETENTKKNVNKIPHLNIAKKKIKQKKENDSPVNLWINTLFRGLKGSNSNSFSSRNNSTKIDKDLAKNDSKKLNLHSIKRRENLNNALSFIRAKKKSKLNSDLDKKQYYSNNTCNISGTKKLTNVNYTNSLTNSNLNTNNSNTQSHSKSKEKTQKILRKVNSGSSIGKEDQITQIFENEVKFDSNIEKTIICLKSKLLFNKLYEKIDTLEKVNIVGLSNKSFFVILCDDRTNLNQFIFSGLFKYYQNKQRFIKIYGDETIPNYILTKDILDTKKFKIFEYNDNGFILKNGFKFVKSAIIITKN